MKTDSNLCLKSSGILVLLFLIGAGQAFSQEVFELPPVSPTIQVAYLNSLPEMDGQVEFDRSVSWVPIPEIDWQDQGTVIWSESTIAGIETEGVMARWNEKDT